MASVANTVRQFRGAHSFSQFPQNHFRARFFCEKVFQRWIFGYTLGMRHQVAHLGLRFASSAFRPRLIGAFVTPFSLLFFLLFGLGCGSYLGSAQRAYHEGRYLEAAEDLGDHEADVPRLEPAKQANYGLYRGLSLMKLGDHEAAGQWLNFAADVEKKRPGSLLPAQRRELEDARDKLAKTAEAESATSAMAIPTRTVSNTTP